MSDLHLVFRVGETDYALPIEEVLMMETWEGAARVPGVAPHVAGLVQIRGDVVPVVDMRARFGLPPVEPTLDTRVVVVGVDHRKVGLKVDLAREVVRLKPDHLREPPEEISRGAAAFVRCIADADERILMVLDGARVIGVEEERHG